MKNKVISIALAIIISVCTLASCTKTEKIAPEQSPANAPKSTHNFTLSWNYNSDSYICKSAWGISKYDLYKNNGLVTSTTINDTSRTEIVINDDNVTITYNELSVPNLKFYITDLTIIDDTTVTFVYRMGDQVLHEFTMTADNDVMEDIIDDYNEDPELIYDMLPPSGPHFRVFPDGTAKVLFDLSVEAINAGNVNPLYDDVAFLCHLAMNQHISGDHGNSPVNHIKNHMFPSHNGCTLMCNGVSVNFH